MGFPQARVGDLHLCTLPAPPPAPPPPAPVPMPVMPPCMVNVLVGKRPAARAMADMVTPANPHPIAIGSFTVLIGNMQAARVKDTCFCGGMITLGEFTVLVGG